MTNSLTKTIYLKAAKPEVWAYLTQPEKMATWFHKPQTVLTEAAEYKMLDAETGDKLMWGAVKTAQPHDYLEFTLTLPDMPDTISTVQITLEDATGGTKMTLVHTDLPGTEDLFYLTLALDSGWDGHFARLRNSIHGTD